MKKQYDVAAYVWPAYCFSKRSEIFWPDGKGEWQTVMSAKPKFVGHSWPRKPLWGYVDEADPKVMAMEIDMAAKHGINVFIYDWYWYDNRPFLEDCLNNGYLKAKNNHKVKFYLMWANHHACTLWDKRVSDREEAVIWQGFQNFEQFKIITDRIIEKYFPHSSYYTIDGKPVFCIYEINTLIKGLGGIKETKNALKWFRKRVLEKGFKGVHLQAIMQNKMKTNAMGIAQGNNGASIDTIKKLGFDSITHYQFVHFTDINREYKDILPDVKKEWEALNKQDITYFPHVSIGWDNNPRFNTLRPEVTKNSSPELFRIALEEAKKYIDANKLPAPLITVNSWNEWTEDSYLEPDNLRGYGYLEAVKKVFK